MDTFIIHNFYKIKNEMNLGINNIKDPGSLIYQYLKKKKKINKIKFKKFQSKAKCFETYHIGVSKPQG